MRGYVLATIVIALVGVLGSACGVDGSERPPTPTPETDTGVVVTFRVVDEEFRIRLTDAADIAIARALLAGEAAPAIPNGVVVRGEPDVNAGYSWHIDPATVEFVDVTTEVCDGRPSDVETGTITSDRYCPWSAQVVAITE
jgi:hypothetical protein